MSKMKQSEENILFGTQTGKLVTIDVVSNKCNIAVRKIMDCVFGKFRLDQDDNQEDYKIFVVDFGKLDRLIFYFNGKLMRRRPFVQTKVERSN